VCRWRQSMTDELLRSARDQGRPSA
jgi:hypothetical protein